MTMMTSKLLIYNYLKNICNLFPDSIVEYSFDSVSKSHNIRFNNLKIIEERPDYNTITKTLLHEFIYSYPYEDILFISEEDKIDIGTAEYVICGFDRGEGR